MMLKSYIISSNVLLPTRKFDLLIFDNQIDTEDAARDFPTIGAVADMTSSLGAEEVFVVDFDLHRCTNVNESFVDVGDRGAGVGGTFA
jgi:hypothetical protein